MDPIPPTVSTGRLKKTNTGYIQTPTLQIRTINFNTALTNNTNRMHAAWWCFFLQFVEKKSNKHSFPFILRHAVITEKLPVKICSYIRLRRMGGGG